MKDLFCNNCRKIMNIEDRQGKKILVCTSCGFTRESGFAVSEITKKAEIKGEGIINVVKKEFKFPHTCPKCNHNGSEVIDLGAHYSDEANVYLFICDKCGYTDRQADGSSNG
jgi:DNA-directed RNA polymerase subunit M/transcription elongation factor TFIIS